MFKLIVYIKKGQILQKVENIKTKEEMIFNCTLDFLIDRFKRTDQRRKTIGFGQWKFTDFGLGFMYGVYFQNLWYAREYCVKEDFKDKEREIYYKTLLLQDIYSDSNNFLL